MTPYALDNGAWSDFQAGRPFDEEGFERVLEKLGNGADFCRTSWRADCGRLNSRSAG
jgi:hypothetical protein